MSLSVSVCLGAGFFFLAQAWAVPARIEPHHFRISGTVVNALSGEPIKAARVTISPVVNFTQNRTVVSGETGSFLFDDVASGKYALSAEARGFAPQSFDQHEQYSTAIAAGVGKQSEGLVFRLLPAASIGGQVIGEFNEPVREAQVFLFRDGIAQGGHHVDVERQSGLDDRGFYHFCGLLPGRYFVAVLASPWYAQHNGAEAGDQQLDVGYPITFFGNVIDSSEASAIVLQAGDRVSGDLRLAALPAPHLLIHMPVNGQNANPSFSQILFGGFELHVPSQVNSVFHGHRKSESGTASPPLDVSGLPPGRYRMHVQSFGNDHFDLYQEVDLFANAEIYLDDKSQASGSAVSGAVTLPAGARLPEGAFVHLSDSKNGQFVAARIAADGHFEFSQSLLPGAYEVSVQIPGYFVEHVSALGATANGPAVEIRGGDAVRLNIATSQRDSLGRIDGIALTQEKPAAGAMILLLPQKEATQTVSPSGRLEQALIRRDQSDSDGTFTLPNVHSGDYLLLAIQDGWNLEWADPAVLGPYLPAAEKIHLGAGEKREAQVRVQ